MIRSSVCQSSGEQQGPSLCVCCVIVREGVWLPKIRAGGQLTQTERRHNKIFIVIARLWRAAIILVGNGKNTCFPKCSWKPILVSHFTSQTITSLCDVKGPICPSDFNEIRWQIYAVSPDPWVYKAYSLPSACYLPFENKSHIALEVVIYREAEVSLKICSKHTTVLV